MRRRRPAKSLLTRLHRFLPKKSLLPLRDLTTLGFPGTMPGMGAGSGFVVHGPYDLILTPSGLAGVGAGADMDTCGLVAIGVDHPSDLSGASELLRIRNSHGARTFFSAASSESARASAVRAPSLHCNSQNCWQTASKSRRSCSSGVFLATTWVGSDFIHSAFGFRISGSSRPTLRFVMPSTSVLAFLAQLIMLHVRH